jgi:hypothetical protein
MGPETHATTPMAIRDPGSPGLIPRFRFPPDP